MKLGVEHYRGIVYPARIYPDVMLKEDVKEPGLYWMLGYSWAYFDGTKWTWEEEGLDLDREALMKHYYQQIRKQ